MKNNAFWVQFTSFVFIIICLMTIMNCLWRGEMKMSSNYFRVFSIGKGLFFLKVLTCFWMLFFLAFSSINRPYFHPRYPFILFTSSSGWSLPEIQTFSEANSKLDHFHPGFSNKYSRFYPMMTFIFITLILFIKTNSKNDSFVEYVIDASSFDYLFFFWPS